MLDNRILIISGSDASIIVRLRNPKTGDPIDLTNYTKIQFRFKNSDRTDLFLDNTLIPATKAQITYSNVIFIANVAGANGNDIFLQFDGVSNIDTVVAAWNTANVGNEVSHNGVGTDVLDASTVRLTDGYDAYSPVEVVGQENLGKVSISILEKETANLRRGNNQSFSMSIDYGTWPGGTRIKGVFDNLNVIDSDL